MHRYATGLSLLLLGCPATPPDFGKDKGGGSTDTGNVDTADTGDTDTHETADPETGETGDTGEADSFNFDEPGDLIEVDADDGSTDILLADESGDSNKDQQFFLILLNAESSAQTYNLRYILDTDVSARRRESPRRRAAPGVRQVDAGPLANVRPMVPRRESLEKDDIGVLVDIFRVREEMDDEGWSTKDATLWALGDHIAIWVDNEVPIDWDYECDGLVDEPDEYQAFGFDNCDLTTVASIFDLNIYPNVTGLFGEPSDINEDGRIDLFISPELNALPLTSSDEDIQVTVLPSFAEPSVDLDEYDIKSNAGSDEREVIYAYAPDPNAYYHSGVDVPINEYTSYSLAAELARSLVALISYNQHILEPDTPGSIEDDWLLDVLGTLGADRCGFGSAFHADAWDYLDLPYNYPLLAKSSKGSLDPSSKGAQYLFGLWLYEWAQANSSDPDAFLAAIVSSEETGVDAVNDALGTYATDTSLDFDDLVMRWQLALLATALVDDSGDALVTDASFTAYADAETLSSPPALRDSLFGANGYQRGLNLRGLNYAWSGGHTDAPELESGSDVKLEGPDFFHYDPAFAFDGWIEADYSAQVVRLDGIPYDAAGLQLQYEDSGFVATVVRWPDPKRTDYAVENIFGPTDANSVALPALPDDGTPIYGIGQLSASANVDVIDATGDATAEEVVDTDRWVLDLTDRSVLDEVRVAVWVDRRFDDAGKSQPDDLWVAVAPIEYIPEPTVAGTHSSGLCTGAPSFAYPRSVLEYLYYQVFLSGEMGVEGTIDDPCGEREATPPTCDVDFDGDDVLDENEPTPTTFIDQVLVQQCTTFGGVWDASVAAYDASWLDVDEQDEDELPTSSRGENVGGAAGTDGEEGFVLLTLGGGARYVVVVGSAGDTGLYELSLRQLR
jgi:hypothetical protein